MYSALIVSAKIVLVSLLIAFILSLVFAWRVSYSYGKKEKFLEWILMMPMFFPPSAIGYIALIILGKNGIIGEFFYQYFDLRIIFTWGAGVITTIIVILPIIYKSIKNGFLSIPKEIREASIIDGTTLVERLKFIEIPLVKRYIYSGVILGIARGFGEFGAVIMVTGNIPNKTQTIPMALYSTVESGDYSGANSIMVLIVIVSILSICLYNYFQEKEE